jgi:hypothetical protein
MSLDLSLKNVTQELKDKISKKVKALTGEEQKTFIFSFKHDGALPGVATIKIFLGKEWSNKKVSLRRYLSDKNTVESVLDQDSVQVDSNGYATFKLNHCSDYFVTEAKLPKTGSPIDLELIILLGGLLIGYGFFMTTRGKSIKK